MAKKQYFCIVDTETTNADTVADFAAVIVDRKGTVYGQCAVLVDGHYGTHELFCHPENDGTIWGRKGLAIRKARYETMLEKGSRMVASVNAINRWIAKAVDKYNPTLTAYNLTFDLDKAQKTAIDLTIFSDSFCLWQLACGNLVNSKAYRQFVLENHLFNAPTDLRNMTFQTNAEVMASFIAGKMLPDEPHTALEDILDYELPILVEIAKKKDWRKKAVPYNWRDCQVKNHFAAKKPAI